MYNQDFLNMIQIISFVIGMENYRQNLTQNDKDDIMNRLDEQTKDILKKLQEEIEAQNEMLRKILEKLEEK